MTPQRINSNWESKTSCFRGLDTRIHRRDLGAYQVTANARAFDIKTKYGMAVGVAEDITQVSRPSSIFVFVGV